MAATPRHSILRLLALTGIAAGALSLAGCGSFFVCAKASCTSTGSGGSGSTTGNYAYVSNSASGSTRIEGYSLGSGTLASLSGFPLNLGYSPSAMAITPADTYLYLANASTGIIYGFSIGSTGALTSLSGGAALAAPSTGTSAIDISPDGKFLFALDATGSILSQYAITSTSGLLGSLQTFSITSTGAISPQSVMVSPNGNFVACALGTGGTVVFPYNSSSGISSTGFASLSTGSASVGDFAITSDTNNILYVARTSGIAAYSVTFPTTTSVQVTSVTQLTLTAGTGPRTIALGKSSGAYVYVGNVSSSTVSGYTATSAGLLADMSGSPFTAPSSVQALERDNSGKYILAAGYSSSNGIQLFSIGSTGALTSVATAASGTSGTIPVVMALTH